MSDNIANLSPQFDGAPGLGLHAIFQRVAHEFPDRTAITDGQAHVTYRELDSRSSRLAAALQQAGVQPAQMVGLCLKRSSDLIAGMLAIAKAGAAYVPIDPNYPADRRHHVLASSGAAIVIGDVDTIASTAGCKVLSIDMLLDIAPSDVPVSSATDGSSVAYVIFTSGSSGEPKGVMIEHRNVVRLFTETNALFGFDEKDVWCNFHSIAFDFSVWEVWGALLFGGRLVIASNDVVRNPDAFHQLLVTEKVTVLNQTPSSFRNLVIASEKTPGSLTDLRHVIFGGERLDCHTLTPWVNQYGTEKPCLINMYGITETTVHVTAKRIGEADLAAGGASPIGCPIPDLQIDIVDESGASVPIGTEGLMYVSGAGLARGYLNRADLTAERFFERINEQGVRARWYNSGDIGMQIRPNEYVYIGRADSQLKIRGYRIEPQEIEACLKQEPGVQDCIVIDVDYGEGDIRLAAYLVPGNSASRGNALLIRNVKARAARKLPNFMQPSAYVMVDNIPTTSNGKLDRKALPRPSESLFLNEPAGLSVAEAVHGIWMDILGVADIADDQEFFDLGGTSFSLIRMMRRVNDLYDTEIALDVLSHGANIGVLAGAIQDRLDKNALSATSAPELPGHLMRCSEQVDKSVEDAVRGIWTEILGVTDIAGDQEFFDLGGTSFSLIRMMRRVNEFYATEITLDVLSRGANIDILADAIRSHLAVKTG